MNTGDLKICDGAAVGAWIEPRRGGEFGAVTLQVPHGYEAYARILHPATDRNGNPAKWAEVAKAVGTVEHREMQWHAILGFSTPEELQRSYQVDAESTPKWAGHDPWTGGMDIDELDVLCDLLIAHTVDSSRCYFGLCTIESWQENFSDDELKPLLKLPMGRDYVVLSGPLSAVDQITRDYSSASLGFAVQVARYGEGPLPEPEGREWKWREAPNLIWPADHSWFVASEVDFDSTLVGGSAGLIKAIIESPDLEAWQLEPTDSLAADADKENRV